MRLFISVAIAAICHAGLFMIRVSPVEEVAPQLEGSKQICLTFSATSFGAETNTVPEEQEERFEEEKNDKPDPPQVNKETVSQPEKPQTAVAVVAQISPRYLKKKVTEQSPEERSIEQEEEVKTRIDKTQRQTIAHKSMVGSLPSGSSIASDSPGKEKEVEASPLYRHNKQPEYPSLARRRGWQGRVSVAVEVAKTGRVAAVRLHQSSGYSILDEAALGTVSGWFFQPGTRNGQPVDMEIIIPIRFTLSGK